MNNVFWYPTPPFCTCTLVYIQQNGEKNKMKLPSNEKRTKWNDSYRLRFYYLKKVF